MRAFSLAALLAFLIDQASKIWVLYGLSMTVGDRWEIFPPFLVFQFGWNPGINFGLFGDSPQIMQYVLIGLAVVISIWLVFWARNTLRRRVTRFSAGLIVGGALANALDRLYYGAVADFLNMSCLSLIHISEPTRPY